MLQGLFIFSELNGTIEITLRANSPRRTEVYKGIVSVAPSATGGVELTSGEPVDYSTIEADKRGIISSPSAWSDGPFMVSNRQSNNSVELRCRVTKNVNYIDWEIRSLPGFNSMQLDSFVYEYVDIGVGIDFTSRYNEVRVPMVRG
jgi:hypothetical protein